MFIFLNFSETQLSKINYHVNLHLIHGLRTSKIKTFFIYFYQIWETLFCLKSKEDQ